MSDDIIVEEVPEPSETPSRFDRFKKFVKDNDTTIVGSALIAGTVFGATRAYYRGTIEELQFDKLVLAEDLQDLAEETHLLIDFIDLKKLKAKYLEFAEANVAEVEKQIQQRVAEQTS